MPNTTNTIVVTTDLSSNSRAGIRFAVHMGEMQNAELIFLHVHHVLRASFWSDNKYQHYVDQFEKIRMEELTAFLKSIFRSLRVTPGNYRLAVHHNLDATEGILEFANKNNASFICGSSHGQGGISKIFGSTISKLITKSNIPVLCVPSTYRVKPINHVLYATDMENFENELKQVVAFARPINASVSAIHVAFDYEKADADLAQTQKKLSEKLKYPVSINFVRRDTSLSLLDSLRVVIKSAKPSIIIFFTNKKETFFERLLTPNNAKEYSYNAKIPFISINKLE